MPVERKERGGATGSKGCWITEGIWQVLSAMEGPELVDGIELAEANFNTLSTPEGAQFKHLERFGSSVSDMSNELNRESKSLTQKSSDRRLRTRGRIRAQKRQHAKTRGLVDRFAPTRTHTLPHVRTKASFGNKWYFVYLDLLGAYIWTR